MPTRCGSRPATRASATSPPRAFAAPAICERSGLASLPMRAFVVCAIALGCLPLTARADIAPSGNLVVDGLPAIAETLATEAGPYGEGRSATPLAWHPVRREILITTRFGDTPQIHSVSFPGADRRQLTFFADPVVSAFYPPDPHRTDHFIF